MNTLNKSAFLLSDIQAAKPSRVEFKITDHRFLEAPERFSLESPDGDLFCLKRLTVNNPRSQAHPDFEVTWNHTTFHARCSTPNPAFYTYVAEVMAAYDTIEGELFQTLTNPE